jgi:tryptophan synthase alpha chain
VADAVIVGSAIVQRIEKLAATPRQIPETVATFLGELRGAIDGAGRH